MNNMNVAYEIKTIYFFMACLTAVMAAKDFGII